MMAPVAMMEVLALRMVVEVPVMAAVMKKMGQSAVVVFLGQWQ